MGKRLRVRYLQTRLYKGCHECSRQLISTMFSSSSNSFMVESALVLVLQVVTCDRESRAACSILCIADRLSLAHSIRSINFLHMLLSGIAVLRASRQCLSLVMIACKRIKVTGLIGDFILLLCGSTPLPSLVTLSEIWSKMR